MYEIIITNYFKKQLKKYTRVDKFLKEELILALKTFTRFKGTSIGKGVYKLRIKDTNRGKSHAYRLYVHASIIGKTLIPICIYRKSQKQNLTTNEISEHLETTKLELTKI